MLSSELYTIIGVNVGLFAAGATLVTWALSKLDSDLKDLGARIDKIDNRMTGHASRIDQLYKMFVDLVKTQK